MPSRSERRIALVLGAGGVVGHAYHAGVLAAIGDVTGWDARDADVLIGTSAGASVAALLRAGLAADDLANRSTGGSMSVEGKELIRRYEDAIEHLPPLPARATRRGRQKMAAPAAVVRNALPPWNVSLGTVLAAALPEGKVPIDTISSGFAALYPEGVWPEAALWINAVDLDTGRRVTFGHEGEPRPDVSTAVAASCAIPSYFAPVVIDGVRYVDGGTHTPTNADVALDANADLVIVIAPMSMTRSTRRIPTDQPFRRLARVALGREVNRLRAAGAAVITFQPTQADLDVMGSNLMDEDRRGAVTAAARASARRRLVRADARDRVAMLATAPTGSVRSNSTTER